MTTMFRNIWQTLIGNKAPQPQPGPEPAAAPHRPAAPVFMSLEIAPDDPIVAHFQSAPGAAEVDRLRLDSPALEALRKAGVKVVVPLVSQGELIGLLNLGTHLSEQEYSTDDRALLSNLATQAAPAVRVAQLVRQQKIEAQAHERLQQELRVARLIQQTLLPKELPALPGYQIGAHYQPARAVGGDFYDFLYLPDGRLGLVVGDVTDKGVPAALVMATTRSILRGAVRQLDSPGAVLEHANDLLCPDIPAKMFVTCLYAILDPASGQLRYANAGHDLPYQRSGGGIEELRATGMPLGLLPGMTYEERETSLAPGDSILFYSDGLIEAHNPQREMFSFGRLRSLVADHPGGAPLINHLMAELADFTGVEWEQEDDVTLVTLQRTSPPPRPPATPPPLPVQSAGRGGGGGGEVILTEFSLPSQPGNEREAMKRVARAVEKLSLAAPRLERLKTAVAEATMNAMEHGNKYQADVPVSIQVLASPDSLAVRITDHGGDRILPEREEPNLEAKLAGEQTPRGWGLFLIKNMVDEMKIVSNQTHHTIELILRLEGDPK